MYEFEPSYTLVNTCATICALLCARAAEGAETSLYTSTHSIGRGNAHRTIRAHKMRLYMMIEAAENSTV